MADHADHDDHQSGETRVTSPMQTYTMREVGIGLVVLVVGLLVAYLLPLFG